MHVCVCVNVCVSMYVCVCVHAGAALQLISNRAKINCKNISENAQNKRGKEEETNKQTDTHMNIDIEINVEIYVYIERARRKGKIKKVSRR